MSYATYRTAEGDMLDSICHKHYGLQAGAVEQVLEFNPGLADLGEVYPENVLIKLPILTRAVEEKTIQLWD